MNKKAHLTLKLLKQLYTDKKINKQQYKTYKGQVVHGDVDACLVGLKRKKLI